MDGNPDNGSSLRAVIRYDENFDGLAMWIMGREKSGVVTCVDPIDMTLRTVDKYPQFPEPTIKLIQPYLGRDFLQSLTNEIARLGFMPDKVRATDAELAAVKFHLDDMRRLVFPPEVHKPA